MESNTKVTQAKTSWQEPGFIFNAGSLYNYLAKLKDGRKRRGIRYSLATILVILILAKLCGQDKAYGIADWAQQRSAFLGKALHLARKRLPHHCHKKNIMLY